MRVWRLHPEEAAAWREIRLEALATAPDAFGSSLADWQHRPLADFAARLRDTAVFAAGTGARPLAVAGWSQDAEDPATAWLESVYTRSEGRGQGASRAVIEAAMADAAAAGKRRMALYVGLANAAARGLYARLGFRFAPRPAVLNPRGIREIVLERPL